MQSKPNSPRVWPIILIVVLAISALAWAGAGGWQQPKQQAGADTLPSVKHIPPKKKKIAIDNEIDVDRVNVHIELNGLDEKIASAVKRAIDESVNAISNIDLHDVDVKVEDIDVEQIQRETKEAVQQAIDHIDIDEINRQVQRALDEARETLRNEELTGHHSAGKYQRMLDRMEDDGLVNTERDLELEYRDGTLYIDGKKQSQEVSKKYGMYFRNRDIRLFYKNGRFTSR